MCGIVGVASRREVDQELAERMRDLLAHRGPDAAGSWTSEDRRVCLGHRRLAIIDPSPEANQPFLSADGRYAITFNGEIYNFRALRAELERSGSLFRTRSDTEVLLESYRRYGERCLDRVSGMFAFAIWDSERRRLFCARDRAGEKPFYYALVGDSFLFASELKSL
ncbi:MAG: asparagine synthetase B family protein, partial [Solirubrobacteraceae bacterium]